MCVKTTDGDIYRYDVEQVADVVANEGETGEIGGYPYVDLGLPSGTKWATYNVGASKLTDIGGYFAWGETKPKESFDYSWTTYKWGSYNSLSKYCTDATCGNVDNVTELDAADDAATANWGADWSMPTADDLRELIDGCDWISVKNFFGSGLDGRVGISKTNANFIFFPAAGCYTNSELVAGSCFYWTKSLSADFSYSADNFYFFNFIEVDYLTRCRGLNVRAVSK